MTDNIVILRLPQGQTRQRKKDRGNETKKETAEIYRAAIGGKGYKMEVEHGETGL